MAVSLPGVVVDRVYVPLLNPAQLGLAVVAAGWCYSAGQEEGGQLEKDQRQSFHLTSLPSVSE
jgi:hypothetical protein